MTESQITLCIAVILIAFCMTIAAGASKAHTEGKKHCDEMHGVWLDRELK